MGDIWISGWLSRGGVKKYVVPGSAMMRSVWRQRRTLLLRDVPEGRQHHNNETIAFLEGTWDVFASKHVRRGNRDGVATTAHRRPPGKSQRW
jgi:hypothetical protein